MTWRTVCNAKTGKDAHEVLVILVGPGALGRNVIEGHTTEVISSKPLLEWFFRSGFGNAGRLQ